MLGSEIPPAGAALVKALDNWAAFGAPNVMVAMLETIASVGFCSYGLAALLMTDTAAVVVRLVAEAMVSADSVE